MIGVKVLVYSRQGVRQNLCDIYRTRDLEKGRGTLREPFNTYGVYHCHVVLDMISLTEKCGSGSDIHIVCNVFMTSFNNYIRRAFLSRGSFIFQSFLCFIVQQPIVCRIRYNFSSVVISSAIPRAACKVNVVDQSGAL